VSSGVPQGSWLGPLLFVIYINYIDDYVGGGVGLVNLQITKIGRVVNSGAECPRLQEDIDRMVKWEDKWQMEFNPEKCEVIHFGRSNLTRKYSVNGRTVRSSVEQRDLGVFVHRSLKTEGHVSNVVKKAHRVIEVYSVETGPSAQLVHAAQFLPLS